MKKGTKITKNPIKKSLVVCLAIIIVIGMGITIYKVLQYKYDKSFNRSFEQYYQKITSYQYNFGSSGLFLNDRCSLDEELDWENQINKFNRNSDPSNVENIIKKYTSCIRNKRVHNFDEENDTISEFSGKIERLITSDQENLADKLLAKCREFVEAKQNYNLIWDDYYNKQITWAYAIQSYIKREISLAERNNAVDSLNKTYDLKNSKVQEATKNIDNIQAERTDLYNRLMSILPR